MPAQKFDKLADVIDFIKQKHVHLNSFRGVHAFKLLRKNDGTKIPFEEMKGAKIKEFEIIDDKLIVVNQVLQASSYKGKSNWTIECKTFLSQIVMINVYDHSAEFFSINSIDFTYIENSSEFKIPMMEDWINDQGNELRAYWVRDAEMENLLSDVGGPKTVKQAGPLIRNLDF